MPSRITLFALALWLGAAPGLASPALRVVYTSNRNGELEPCHCAEHQLGGVARLAVFLDQERKGPAPVFWGDAGDAFFSLPALPEVERAREWARARAIARSFAKLGLNVFTPGERDFAEGLDRLKELRRLSGAVFVASNLTDAAGKPIFEKSHVFQIGALRVGVVGLASVEAFAGVEGVNVSPPEPALDAALESVRAQKVDVVILLSHLGLPADRKIAASGKVSLILGGHSSDPLPQPLLVGKALVMQPLEGGQQAGALTYEPGRPIAKLPRLSDLDETFDLAPRKASRLVEILGIVATYKKAIHDLGEEGERDSASQGSGAKPFVAHPFECRRCHKAQYDFWTTTKHAGAYLTLYAKNTHFDPSCVSCHTLGYNQPGGFERIAAPMEMKGSVPGSDASLPTVEQLMQVVFKDDKPGNPLDSRIDPKRFDKLKARYLSEVHRLEGEKKIQRFSLGVQCEHCHGNMNGHPGPGGPKPTKVAETTCRGCHRPPNAPEFDPRWRTRVACPLMAKPRKR